MVPVGLFYLAIMIIILAFFPKKRFMDLLPKTECTESPFVSIIMPVKNEGDTLKDSLSSILNQDYPKYEVIVVYGESNDNTLEVLRTFKARHLKVLNEPSLPKGWIGKNWACYNGYLASRGELLLFTDGDTIHSRDLLKRSVCTMLRDKASMLTLLPRLKPRSFWEKIVVPLIGIFIMIYTRAWSINRDGGGFLGNGQYLLVRRKDYEVIGGHKAVRDIAVEDYALAYLFHRNGFRIRLYVAGDDFKVMMYRNFREVWEGWTKNLFLGIRGLPWYVMYVIAIFITIIAPFILLPYFLYHGWMLPSYILSVYIALMLAFACFVYGKAGVHPIYALFLPLGTLVVILAMTGSMIKYYRGGISWKGRKYKSRRVFE